MNSDEVKDELKILATNYDITIDQVRDLVYYVFKFVRDKMKSVNIDTGYYPAIRLIGLGIFYVKQIKRK